MRQPPTPQHLRAALPICTPPPQSLLGAVTSALLPQAPPPSHKGSAALPPSSHTPSSRLPRLSLPGPDLCCTQQSQPRGRSGGRARSPVPAAGGAGPGPEPRQGVSSQWAWPRAVGAAPWPWGGGAESAQTPLLRKWGAGEVGAGSEPEDRRGASWRMWGQGRGGNGHDSCRTSGITALPRALKGGGLGGCTPRPPPSCCPEGLAPGRTLGTPHMSLEGPRHVGPASLLEAQPHPPCHRHTQPGLGGRWGLHGGLLSHTTTSQT